MSVRDVAFWIRSARTDAIFEKLRNQHGRKRPLIFFTQRNATIRLTAEPLALSSFEVRKSDFLLAQSGHTERLDVGCGLGPFTRRLSAYATQVLGVDFSGAAIEQARKLSTSQSHVRYEWADVYNLSRLTSVSI